MKKIFYFLILILLISGCTKSTIKKNGCSKAALTGNICLPNIFTPNGDQINDVLYVRQSSGLPQIDSLEFYIRDGVGTIIFATTDPAVGWDGAYQGKVKSGVYQSEITAILSTGETIDFSGTVTCLPDSPNDYVVNNCGDCRFDSQFDGHGNFDTSLPSGEPDAICE